MMAFRNVKKYIHSSFYHVVSIAANIVFRMPKLRAIIKPLIPISFIVLTKKILYKKQLHDIKRRLEIDENRIDKLGIFLESEPPRRCSFLKTVRVDGPLGGIYSISIVNRAISKELLKEGFDVSVFNIDGEGNPQQIDAETIEKNTFLSPLVLRGESMNNIDLNLRYQYPPTTKGMQGKIKSYHSYGWEESGVPNYIIEEFNNSLDFLSVASTFVAKTLRDNGVMLPIVVTGHGPSPITSDVIESGLRLKLKRFVFLHISSGFPRKGIDVLLKAYGEAFRDEDDVSLLIKTFCNIHNETEKILDSLRNNDNHFPHVVLINEQWTDERIGGLYAIADWFVYPSRGEGFGLPLLDAMKRGVPVITTGYGGQIDFCNKDNSLLVEFEFQYSSSHVASQISPGMSVWAEPSQRHLTSLLRKAFEMPLEERAKMSEVARKTASYHSWKKSTHRIISAGEKIEQYEKEVKNKKNKPIIWVTPWNSRCGIATYSRNLSKRFHEENFLVFSDIEKEAMMTDESFVFRLWKRSDNNSASLKAIIEQILALKPRSVVIQHQTGLFGIDWIFEILVACQKVGADSFLDLHNPREIFRYFEGGVIELKQILRFTTRIFVHSLSDLNLFRELGKINNVTLFPIGIFGAEDKEKPEEVTQWLDKLPKNNKIIASYGFLLPHKGISKLVKGFSELCRKRNDVHLLLVNALQYKLESMEEKRAIERLIVNLGLSQKVIQVHEFLSDGATLALLKRADIIAFPYQKSEESSSGAVKMGLAAKRPVIVTPLQIFEDLPQKIVARFDGFTESDIAEGLNRLLSNRREMDRLVNESTLFIEERKWSKQSLRFYKIIEGCENQRLFSAITNQGT